VDGARLQYTPYRREGENKTYRSANQVRKRRPNSAQRQGADNLFYSPISEWLSDDGDYKQVWESMPDELRRSLHAEVELKVILRDALRALPLISQRALRAMVEGIAVADIAAAEGIAEQTMAWLIESAKERLRDILTLKLNGDDGQRFVE
jgi:DNA-directed RNA polymerase specialized sigma24 family protein